MVRNLKKTSSLTVKIQPLKELKLAVVSDASFGNDEFHSQGGQMILAHEPGLKSGEKVKANLLWWRSGRLQRIVNSTLAAETQAMARGLGDLMWMKVLFKELENEQFNIHEWPATMKREDIVAMMSSESSLQECLAIIDAKSLYDYLSQETIGGQDKRTAIEVQIIRQDLLALNGAVRWVDHPSVVADCLTKVKGSAGPLYRLLDTGQFCIAAESESLKRRSEERQSGRSASQIRHTSGVNNYFGELCKHDVHVECGLTPYVCGMTSRTAGALV